MIYMMDGEYIAPGPFKNAVENVPIDTLNEVYTRRMIKDDWLVEEQWTRVWSKGDYIDSMTCTPICKIIQEIQEIK